MKEELKNIIRTPLEDVMHDSFMPYAEYVILERAIPRVEDGLKPVQRHILFAMHEMQILPTGSHKKCLISTFLFTHKITNIGASQSGCNLNANATPKKNMAMDGLFFTKK